MEDRHIRGQRSVITKIKRYRRNQNEYEKENPDHRRR